MLVRPLAARRPGLPLPLPGEPVAGRARPGQVRPAGSGRLERWLRPETEAAGGRCRDSLRTSLGWRYGALAGRAGPPARLLRRAGEISCHLQHRGIIFRASDRDLLADQEDVVPVGAGRADRAGHGGPAADTGKRPSRQADGHSSDETCEVTTPILTHDSSLRWCGCEDPGTRPWRSLPPPVGGSRPGLACPTQCLARSLVPAARAARGRPVRLAVRRPVVPPVPRNRLYVIMTLTRAVSLCQDDIKR